MIRISERNNSKIIRVAFFFSIVRFSRISDIFSPSFL